MGHHSLTICLCMLLVVHNGVAEVVPKYTITTILNKPFTMMETGSSKTNRKLIGYIPDLVSRLSEMLNFDYEIVLVKDHKYGSKNLDGNWSGLIGELLSNEADIAAAPLAMTSSREADVDFINTFMHVGLTALIKRPEVDQQDAYQHFTFLRPFSTEVFIVIVVAYVLVSLFLWAMNVYNPYEWAGRANRLIASPAQVDYFSARGSFWYTFTLMQWQGFDRSPRSLASRTLTCFWMAFVTLTLTFYTASLFSLISFPQPASPAPVQTIEDIIASPDMEYGCTKDGFIERYLSSGVGPMFDQFRKYANSHPESFVGTSLDGVEKVRKGNGRYAYICESSLALALVNRKPCNVEMLQTMNNVHSYGLAVREDFPMRNQFHRAMLQLHEAREIIALERKWFYDRGECWNTGHDVFGKSRKATPNKSMLTSIFGGRGVSLRLFSGPLVLLLIGFILALLLTFLEVVYYKYRGQLIQADSQKLEEAN